MKKNVEFRKQKLLTNIRFVFYFVFVFSAIACVSKTSLLNQVTTKTSTLSAYSPLYDKPHLTLKADSILKPNNFTVLNKKSSYFLPLIIYWGWKQKYEVELPKRYLANVFNKVLITKDKDFEYGKHFGNKRLEIEIISLPNNFYYCLKGTYIFVPYFTGTGLYFSYEEIYPEKQKIGVKFKFSENEIIIKSGTKSIEMFNPVSKVYNPAGENISYYIDDYRKEFEFLSGQLFDMVIDDL